LPALKKATSVLLFLLFLSFPCLLNKHLSVIGYILLLFYFLLKNGFPVEKRSFCGEFFLAFLKNFPFLSASFLFLTFFKQSFPQLVENFVLFLYFLLKKFCFSFYFFLCHCFRFSHNFRKLFILRKKQQFFFCFLDNFFTNNYWCISFKRF